MSQYPKGFLDLLSNCHRQIVLDILFARDQINYCLQHIRGEVSEVKYKKGDIVCLFDGRTVYVFDVDNKEKEYQVSNTEEEGTLFTNKENEIFMKIV